jgi:hypothetical protein
LFTQHINQRFACFYLNLIFGSSLGLFFDLDGIVLVLVLTELTLLFVFFLVYSQLTSAPEKKQQHIRPAFLLTALCFGITLYAFSPELLTVGWVNFYNLTAMITAADFFTIYYFFFIKYYLLTMCLIIVLGLFSIFFILLYFTLQYAAVDLKKTKKTIYFLRKQLFQKQAIFTSKLK